MNYRYNTSNHTIWVGGNLFKNMISKRVLRIFLVVFLIFLLIFNLGLISSDSTAQVDFPTYIEGRVRYRSDKQPADNITITLVGENIFTVFTLTNDSGY